jgi:hypothetical protein
LISVTEPEVTAQRQRQQKDLAVEMFWFITDTVHKATKAKKNSLFLSPHSDML